jgi:TonB-linked SusC/RagA family outer membrane protein
MKKILLFTVSLFLAATALAQTRVVTGKVTSADETGGFPGASVLVQGTNKGVSTDMEGNYSLEVGPEENTLVFSFVGYKTQTVDITNRDVVDVVLEADATNLDEVVVIGYGTQRKRDLTGSIVSIKGAEIADKPNGNPLNSLQGKVAGVTITNSGTAGASPTIRIRGVGSIANTNPLYVVDGILLDNIDFINPADIESMEILKDASSLAIYGMQGANGVVIITTKKAKVGQTNINFNSYAGFQQVTNKIDVTNAEEYKMLYNEELSNQAKPAYDFSNYTADTDWQDEILRSALIMNYSLGISSATERHQTSFSINYFKQDGVVKYDSYSRYTAHLRDEFTINKHVKVGGDITLNRWTRDPQTADLNNAIWAVPVYAPRNENGIFNVAPDYQRAQVGNPVARMEIFKDKTISEGYRVVGSAFVELKFLKSFTYKSVFYTDLGFNKSRSYVGKYSYGPNNETIVSDISQVSQQNSTFTTWQMDHTLTYANTFGDHDITVLAGITQQYRGDDFISGTRQGKDPLSIPDDPDLWYLNIGDNDPTRTNAGGANEETYASFLFRANYAFKNKYLLNLSYRRDGTSKFNPFNRWDNFGSVGAGWVITEESFFNLDAINFLKIKASWGKLGNAKIGNYKYYPVLNTGVAGVFGENVYPAAVPAYIPNPNIRWEGARGTDVGFEAIFFNKLTADFSYYNRETTDILVEIQIPGAIGADLSQINAGTILNKGIEIQLGWNDTFLSDWNYSVSGNLTTTHNEVTAIGDNEGYNIIQGNSRTELGHPVGAFFGYVQEGIFQSQEEIDASPQAGTGVKPGDIRYKDINKSGTFDDKDRTFIGSPIPDVAYGISLSLGYKGFAVGIDFQGVAGNEIYRQRATNTFAPLNYEANRLDRWVGPGTSNHEPIMNNARTNNFLPSTYFLDKADYFRIRNISLSYDLPVTLLEKVKIKSAKVYINAQNVFTFTKATGYSPEVGGSPLSFGVDNGVYPIPASYTLGVNLNF